MISGVHNKKQSIFITGNGFDIKHGIHSKYEDFREYLYVFLDKKRIDELKILFEQNIYSQILNKIMNMKSETEYLELMFAIIESKVTNKTWNEFEDALNFKLVFKNIIEFIEGGEIVDGKIVTPLTEGANGTLELLSEWGDCNVKQVLHKLSEIISCVENSTKKYFRKWIEDTIEKDMQSKKKDNKIENLIADLLEKGCLFATFNYTSTLQQLYNVKDVVHIHGNIQEDEDITVGYGEENLISQYVAWIYKEGKIEKNIEAEYDEGKWIEWISEDYNPYYKSIVQVQCTANITDKKSIIYAVSRAGNKADTYSLGSDILAHYGEILNKLRKKTGDVIDKCSLFTPDKLKDIKYLYIYGWGVGICDYPYIMKILAESREETVQIFLSDYTYTNVNEFYKIKKRIDQCAGYVGKKVIYANMKC